MSPSIEFDADEAIEAITEIADQAIPDAVRSTLLQAAEEAISVAQAAVPVQTGALKASIRILQEGEGYVVIGSDLDYAATVEFGGAGMVARPYIGPAADKMNSRFSEIFAEELGNRLTT